ncbi:MAG: peptide chain release factor N(5)-glutamine methyltransferase, partial [Muribaculaceae bacterium]|nr:peptide chain release factor N(5)-glutamine methyltransferase [Muribaculaceae bacterium]
RETEAIIRLIFFHLKGWKTVDMIIHEPDTLSPFLKSEIDDILRRLLNHEPIQYITGTARFHGLDFFVSPDVLIPRPETEELVDMITDQAEGRQDLRVLDMGTGSGCIAISLARSLNFPKITAIDISERALEVAKRNAAQLKTDIRFIHADIFTWEPQQSFDIIVSNPPYIDESEKTDMDDNVLLHEPHTALFVPDSDPLLFYRRIVAVAWEHLTDGGRLYFEINPRHSEAMKTLVEGFGFRQTVITRDSFGKERFLSAEKPCL